MKYILEGESSFEPKERPGNPFAALHVSKSLSEIDRLRLTVAKNEKKIAEYIREQLQSDIMEDQISLKEFVDPFTGEKNK